MADLAPSTANAMIAAGIVPGTTYYLSQHTASPGATGTNEVTGGSYARQPITFGAASDGSEVSTDAQSFTGMPAVAILDGGIWTAVTAGTFLGGGPVSVNSGAAIEAAATVDYAAGAITAAVS